MRAVTWQGRREVTIENVPDPIIKEPTDAIIKPGAYEKFQKKQDGMVKVVLTP